MYYLTGIGIATCVTVVIISFFRRASSSSGDRGFGLALAFRGAVEFMLVMACVSALVATAVIGTTSSWQLFAGYLGARVVGLVVEAALCQLG